MTSPPKMEFVTCAVCGWPNACWYRPSWNTFGSWDLDLREPPMGRIGIRCYECENCGYVARWLDTRPKHPEILESDEYRKASKMRICRDARTCWKMYLLDAGDPMAQLEDLRRAAWACDDAGKPAQAVRMRKKALKLINEILAKNLYVEAAKEEGEDPEDWRSGIIRVKFDFMRRAGMFGELEEEYRKLLAHPLENEMVMKVIRFIHHLALEKDTAVWNTDDAMDSPFVKELEEEEARLDAMVSGEYDFFADRRAGKFLVKLHEKYTEAGDTAMISRIKAAGEAWGKAVMDAARRLLQQWRQPGAEGVGGTSGDPEDGADE